MISLDTETTGVDFRHGARPFFVTTCDDAGGVTFWEWDVNPLTREPEVPEADLEEIRAILAVARGWGSHDGEIRERHTLILQNPKFDCTALAAVGVKNFPWGMVRDTLTAGHLLASNQPHDLTSMTLHYLGEDIEHHEKRLEKVVQECRRYCRSHLPTWRIASSNEEDMPSAKEKTWKTDTWLPRALVKYLWETSEAGKYWRVGTGVEDGLETVDGWEFRPPEIEGGDDPRWTALRDYANADSEATMALWLIMRKQIQDRKLWAVYLEKLKGLPVAYEMEDYGLTLSGDRTEELREEYVEESARAERICVNLASGYTYEGSPYNLQLPKNGVNQSLRTFMFDVLKLKPCYNGKAKTSNPTLDKGAMAYYLETLPPRSPQLKFVQTLLAKRKRDTAIAYMDGYRRFWLPWVEATGWYVLHPNLNPTGTGTLRWSSSNPNEQNIGKQESECPVCRGEGCEECHGSGKDLRSLRWIFGPAPGREWWSKDAKNIELRIPAYESGEQELIDLFERSDEPPYYGSEHLLNFSTVYPDIWEAELGKVCKDCCKGQVVDLTRVGPHCKKKYAASWYQWCKNGGFAVGYGAIDRKGGTADRAFHRVGSHARLKTRFGKKEALNQKYIKLAEKYGYVETIPDKMVDPDCGYPLMCTRTEYGRILPTVPLNYHVQGTAMQWTAKGMVRVHAFYQGLNRGEKFQGRVWPGGYHLIMQVHDELVSDCPSGEGKGANSWDYNLPVMRYVQGLMAQGGDDIGIPTPVGLEYHAKNWSEGVTL